MRTTSRKCMARLGLFISLITLAFGLQAQQTIGAAEFPRNSPMTFEAVQSMFYYSDIGYQTDHEAVLLAANAEAGGSMIYNTSDAPVYVVGHGTKVYIAKSVAALDSMVLVDDPDAKITTTTEYSVQVNSPSTEGNANLSLFILQLEEDESGERFMYVDAIGVAVIQDVDPSNSNGIQIENDQVFSIQTQPISDSNSCAGTGNHSLVVKW